MIKAKALNMTAVLGASFMVGLELLFSGTVLAQTVTMDDDMLERCNSEGLSGETCACWFTAIAEDTGMTEFTEEDIDEVADLYQDELAACMDVNQDAEDMEDTEE